MESSSEEQQLHQLFLQFQIEMECLTLLKFRKTTSILGQIQCIKTSAYDFDSVFDNFSASFKAVCPPN
jgi:hypothetical protein